MKKHFVPFTSLICLIVTIFTLLYLHFEKGDITLDGWGTLVMMISFNMMNLNYWKEYFSKD